MTFIGLWTEADDEGRLIDSAKMLAGSLFPHDDEIDAKQVDAWLAELERIGVISRYAAGHGRYIQVNNWTEHQRVPHAKASTLPEPPTRKGRAMREQRVNGSRTAPEPCAPEQGTGNREQGSARAVCAREPELDAEFEACWSEFPKRKRRPEALKAYRARRREGIDGESLLAATRNYSRKVGLDGTAERFVMYGATFYGPNERWKDYLEAEAAVPLYATQSYGSPV